MAQFLELANEPLKEYENYVLMSARNRPNFRLKGILHGCSWRFCKLFALLNDVGRVDDPNFFVLSWMPFGPDACGWFLSIGNLLFFSRRHKKKFDRCKRLLEVFEKFQQPIFF